ncbi:MAG: NAD(P)/FAD-dependent oxidoreductase [Rhodospirillaceae bacterium]|nr:NAD(P)/FAD-dependent oxidoreductase [Rhodospirillaceae bacterium]
MPALSRRHLIASAAAAPLIRTGRAKAADTVDVVVVGAGLSGLNAAWILSDAGYDVAVLEGSQRVGGRAWTTREAEDQPELGASQVGPSYARGLDIIQRLGLKLIAEDRPIMPFAYHLGGQLIAGKDWPDHPLNKTVGAERKMPPQGLGNAFIRRHNAMKELDDWLSPKLAAEDVSVADFMRRHGASPAALKLAAIGMDLHESSALGLMQEDFRSTFEQQFGTLRLDPAFEIGGRPEVWPKNIVGGTSMLPEAMAAQLGRPVMFDKLAAAIDMDEAGVEVRCLDGTSVRAKFVVAAIPFALLRQIDITPRPDGLHTAAIETIGYRDTTWCFVKIREPFWQADGTEPSFFTDTALRTMWVLDNHSGEPNAPTKGPFKAMFLVTGRSGERLMHLPPDQASAFLIAELERLRPAAKGQVAGVKFHSWGRTPLQKGCRHNFKPGQITAFAEKMIEPWQRLHFCGEHTRRLEQGMESAFESGERAAGEILARLS